MRPADVAALRTVTVSTARPGPEDGAVTVQLEDLRWKGGSARAGGLVATACTLAQSGELCEQHRNGHLRGFCAYIKRGTGAVRSPLP